LIKKAKKDYKMEKKQICLQVYSARNFKPYEDIFKFLSEEGMKNVELFEV